MYICLLYVFRPVNYRSDCLSFLPCFLRLFVWLCMVPVQVAFCNGLALRGCIFACCTFPGWLITGWGPYGRRICCASPDPARVCGHVSSAGPGCLCQRHRCSCPVHRFISRCAACSLRFFGFYLLFACYCIDGSMAYDIGQRPYLPS